MWMWTEIMQSPSFVSVATLPPCLPNWTISSSAYRPSPIRLGRSRRSVPNPAAIVIQFWSGRESRRQCRTIVIE